MNQVDSPEASRRIFELEYELTTEDFVAYSNHWYADLLLRPWFLDLLAGVIGAFMGLAVAAAFRLVAWSLELQWDPVLNWFYAFTAFVGAIMAIPIGRRDEHRLREKFLASEPTTRDRQRYELHVGRRQLTVSADGFKVDGPNGHTSRTWRVATGIRESDYHVMLVTDDVAVIVPRRAFSTNTECDDFVAAVKGWSQQ